MRRTPLACDLCFNTGLSGHSGVVKQHASRMLTNATMPTGLIVRAAVRGSRKWAAHWGPPVSDAHQMRGWWRGIMVTCERLKKSHGCRLKCFLDGGNRFEKSALLLCILFDDNRYMRPRFFAKRLHTVSLRFLAVTLWAYLYITVPTKCIFTALVA